MRTPLLALSADGDREIYIKLEILQPIGSFKLRGAANAMLLAGHDALRDGVYTASAGNMAQGVAWCARHLGIPCTVIVPESAPATKIAAVLRLGAEVVKLPFDEWWQVIVDHRRDGMAGVFVHPFADAAVMAGNATIGLELLEDQPALDAVLVPWGGGGLACGIASAVRHAHPGTRILAVEVDGAAPLHASYSAGEAMTIAPVRSFVDGIGGNNVAPEMWTLARALLDGVITVSVGEVAAAIRLLAERNRVIAEGAGAASVAAALAGVPGATRVACIVSGGNIDIAKLATILRGDIP